jgi:acetyl esterase/lipase
LEDCLAHVKYLRQLPYVDPKSVIVFGCSGGGDLALEIAAATRDVCAIIAEEPSSYIFAGLVNKDTPKKGARFGPLDSQPIGANPERFYTPQYQKITRGKIAKIQAPILMLLGNHELMGHPNWVVRFNERVLIPELQGARKRLDVIHYPGEPHCFCFYGNRPAAALKAFRDAEAFCRRYIKTMPKTIDARHVKQVPAVEPPPATRL